MSTSKKKIKALLDKISIVLPIVLATILLTFVIVDSYVNPNQNSLAIRSLTVVIILMFVITRRKQ